LFLGSVFWTCLSFFVFIDCFDILSLFNCCCPSLFGMAS